MASSNTTCSTTIVEPHVDLLQPEVTDRLATQYKNSKLFPHIPLDGLLSKRLDCNCVAFPDLDWPGWKQFDDGYQFGKRVCNDETRFPVTLREVALEACQPRFLQFVEQLAGIDNMIPDPGLNEDGLHSSGAGCVLAPHTDCRVCDRFRLYRRSNVIIYLNAEWNESDGGDPGLSEKGASEPSMSISPVFGRTVLFNTDDQSIHGFTKPIAQDKCRNSIALSYYTAQEVGVFNGDRTTHSQIHGSQGGLHVARIGAYKALLFVSRAFSKLAHLVNPDKSDAAPGQGSMQTALDRLFMSTWPLSLFRIVPLGMHRTDVSYSSRAVWSSFIALAYRCLLGGSESKTCSCMTSNVCQGSLRVGT